MTGQDPDHVVLCFPIRRDTAIFLDRAGACIVSGQGQHRAFEGLELCQQIARTAIEVLHRIMRIDAKKPRGARHQLCKANRSLWRACACVVSGFLPHQRVEKGCKLIGGQTRRSQAGMMLVTRCSQSDAGSHAVELTERAGHSKNRVTWGFLDQRITQIGFGHSFRRGNDQFAASIIALDMAGSRCGANICATAEPDDFGVDWT